MPDSASIAPRAFDERAARVALGRIARGGEAPWLHREAARRMGERLSIVKRQPAIVLDWWSMTGGSAEVLATAYPGARRIAVEPAEVLAMRRDAPKPRWWRRRPESIGEHDVQAENAGLVWANMMLHAVRDPARTMLRWQSALAEDAFLMFSCFGPDSLRELRRLYEVRGWPAPHADFVDMHDLGDMLLHAGFADPVMDQEQITLTWQGGGALLDELRGLGVNASPLRFAGLRTPRWRDTLRRELDALGTLGVTFEIIYGHAFKAPPRSARAAITTVPLDEMRSIVRSRGRRPVR